MPAPARKTPDLLRYTDLGIRFGLTVALPSLGGHWLDGWLDSSPWLLLTGCAFGFGAAMYTTIRAVDRLSRDGDDERA